MEIIKLAWDSDFFGFDVCQVMLNSHSSFNKTHLDHLAKDCKLTYVVSSENIQDENFKGELVDVKCFLEKFINGTENIPHTIKEYAGIGYESLLKLSIESGIHSRFNKDGKIGNKLFEKLYKAWIDNSIEKLIADHVSVVYDGNICVGFITLKFHEEFSKIGLIAVDKKFRGKGIGTSLLHYAANLTYNKGLPRMEVITQFYNENAMNLYYKNGFTLVKKDNIYHLWK